MKFIDADIGYLLFVCFPIPLPCAKFNRDRMLSDMQGPLLLALTAYPCIKKFPYFLSQNFFTFSSHTEYVKREYCNRVSEKKNSLLLTNVYDFYLLEDKTSKKKSSVCLFVCMSVRPPARPSVRPSVRMYVRTWTFHVDTITFEGVSGSKKNLVGVFYVWNVGLVLKSKVISWSWSWFWTEFWFFSALSIEPPVLICVNVNVVYSIEKSCRVFFPWQ